MNGTMVKKQAWSAIKIFLFCTLVFGLLYPAVIYGVDQLCFSSPANGTQVQSENGSLSLLAGQSFTDDDHLWGRMQKQEAVKQADGTYVLKGVPANNALDDPAYQQEIQARKEQLLKANPDARGPVPQELYTYSASGLDPQISLEAALWQAPRIAKAKNMNESDVQALIEQNAKPAFLNLFGEKLVNVNAVNLALDGLDS